MKTNHVKLNARRWATTRRSVFQRDSYPCTSCGRPERLEAHHTHRLRDGLDDPYDISFIETRCRACHVQEHRADDLLPGRAKWLDYLEELT